MKRIGASLFAVLLLGSLAAAPASGGDKAQPYAVVAGTVFREPGYMLPGAEVTLTVKSAPPHKKLPKSMQTRTDARGEFAFRLPAGKADYVLSVKANGFVGQEKPAAIAEDERIDVYFELQAIK